jgi:hypothetical protein
MTQSHLFLRKGVGNLRGISTSRAPRVLPLLGVSSWMLVISLGWAMVAAWSIVHHAILG